MCFGLRRQACCSSHAMLSLHGRARQIEMLVRCGSHMDGAICAGNLDTAPGIARLGQDVRCARIFWAAGYCLNGSSASAQRREEQHQCDEMFGRHGRVGYSADHGGRVGRVYEQNGEKENSSGSGSILTQSISNG